MGKQIYDKPIWRLFREFADRQREGDTFAAAEAVDWFRKNYPKIKEGSVKAHLIRLTTNNPTRVHYKAQIKMIYFFNWSQGGLEDTPPIRG